MDKVIHPYANREKRHRVNFLNLPSWEIVKSRETDDDYEITARSITPPTACPFCGKATLLRQRTDAQEIHDVPSHGKRVTILIDHQRFRCTSCGKTFFEPLPDVDEKRFCTRRLIKYLERRSMSRTFLSLAEEVGLHEKAVRRIFHDYAQEMKKSTHFATSRISTIEIESR